MPKSIWLVLLLLCGGFVVAPAKAADEPDLIFKRSTVFKLLTPNDKLATYGLDDPDVEGVACHFTVPERGGVKGWLGVAEQVSDISLACRQIGPIRFKAKFEQGEERVPQAPLTVLQEDADRARLRHQAERAGLHGLFRPPHRRFAEELDLVGADHALGTERPNTEVRGLRRKVILATLLDRPA
jgi:CreA protein